MTDWSTTLSLGTLSGLLFVALGALAMLRSKHRIHSGLALFLMVWGAQLVATNVAPRSSHGTAFLLFWMAQLFIPLQAILLLRYVWQRTDNSRLQAFCRWTAAAVATSILLGLIVALIAPSEVLTIQTRNDGYIERNLGPWSNAFKAPQIIGVTLALGLLSWNTPSTRASRQDWLLLVGLSCAWASHLAYNSAVDENRITMMLQLAGLAATVLLVPARLIAVALKGSSTVRASHIALTLLVPLAAIPYFIPAAWSLGAFRLAAGLALLLPAIWMHAPAPELPARSRTAPVWVAVCAISLAIAMMALSTLGPQFFATLSSTYVGGLVVASVLLIAGPAGQEARRLLVEPTQPVAHFAHNEAHGGGSP